MEIKDNLQAIFIIKLNKMQSNQMNYQFLISQIFLL